MVFFHCFGSLDAIDVRILSRTNLWSSENSNKDLSVVGKASKYMLTVLL